jgi:imidazole glycerol-phosphate synthase subunit HisH
MARIALVDYGAGNLTSVRKGLHAAAAEVFAPQSPDDLSRADGIVVPGVGHFASTAALSNGWRAAITAAVKRGTPLLGICLGLQWLFDSSAEAPGVPGLGAIAGRCERLPPVVKVPHVGWNSLEFTGPSVLLRGLADGTQVYFTHTYAAPLAAETVAAATHGTRFSAAVERDRVFGVQFHPEKSGPSGIRILTNFVELAAGSARET